MHGAAQIANAPPSSNARATAPRALHEPGTDEPLGPGQQAHEGEPEDDEDEARRSARAGTGRGRGPPPISWAPTPSSDEDGREPEHERDAREHDAPGRAAVSEPVRLDGRDGREVAGHERQHARGEERDEARERARRVARSAARASFLEPGELLVHPPLELGVERARSPPRPWRHVCGSTSTRAPPTTTAPTASAPSGKQPGEEVEPTLRRLGEDGRAELVDELAP